MKILNDNYFTYRQVPVDYDGLGKITDIRGNTLVWNQLVQNGNFADTSGWSGTRGSLSASNNELTYTITEVGTSWNQNRINTNFVTTANHIYYIKADIKPKTNKTLSAVFLSASPSKTINFMQTITANQWNTVSAVTEITFASTSFYLAFNVDSSYSVGDTVNVRNVMIFDLTAMGLDTLSLAEVQAWFSSYFPLPYYDYTQGKLLPFKAEELKTTNADETETNVLSLPTLTYFHTGLKSAGSVYDELTPNKAITRIGSVDLGTLTWTYNSASGHQYFVATLGNNPSLSIVKPPSSNTVKVNAECAKYALDTYGHVYDNTSDLIFGVSTNRAIGVRDTSFGSDAVSFKSSLSGQYLFFELDTPTETDIEEDLSYYFYKGGTEQILPENTSAPTTTPILCDITYYDTTEGDTPYRKFWMINSNNERWNLTERELKTFLNNPQGLGFQKNITTNRFGNAQTLTDITDTFPTPNGEVLFYDSANASRYEKYNEFVKFLSYDPITLYYQLPFSIYSQIPNIYTLECVVGTLTKTESKNDGLMTCPITFNALSFYKGDPVEINGSGLTYTLTNNADFPIGFEIELDGSLVNPYITLEQDNELYGEAKFIDSVAFDNVYIDSIDGEQNLILEQGGSVLPNPLSYQDLSISNGSIYVTFVKLARGESTLTIGMDSGSLTSAKIKFTPIYRSV